MESNKDEAIKCLAIAQKHRDAGNFPSARRFCEKSISLFSTSEGQRLLQQINVELEAESSTAGSSSVPSSSSSSAEVHPSATGARQRHAAPETKANGSAKAEAGAGQKKREYTPEHAAVVKRVRTCKVTEYYEILSVKKDCDDGEIKKAYRKVRRTID